MSSTVDEALAAYVAGRVPAERVAIAVAAAYYGRETGDVRREALRPLLDIIERAAPGIVELGSVEGPPGFDLRLAERPFPARYGAELRRAVEAYLASRRTTGVLDVGPAPVPPPAPGLFGRLVRAVRRLFTGPR